MKKRIFMLALVVGAVLSVCASAWADGVAYYFKLGSTTYLGKEVVDKDTNTVRASFQVVLVYRTSSSAPSGYSKNANLVKWTISETDGTFNPTAVTIYRGTRTETESEESSFVTDPYYLTEIIDTPSETDTDVTATLTIETTGTMEDPSNTLSISVSLYKADTDGTELVTTSTISSAQKDDSTSTTVAVDDTVNADTLDKRDPDSVFWNGLDPTFSNTINKTSYDIGKNKPKLGKIDKTKLTFTPNTASDLEIPMLGPIELVDVYIAEKDAKKLYPASADSISGNIRLTSASIKAYKIPFRVTATNFATTVSATGDTADKLKKAQAKAWKSAENTLTLSFNGSKMQYKGFPITIAMSNSNNSSKPTAKAIKLNIGSTYTTPAWTYTITSYDTTTDEETAAAWEEDEATTESGTYPEDEWTSTGDAQTTVTAPTGTAAGETFTDETTGTLYILSTDEKVYAAKQVIDYYYRYFTATKTVTKSDKLEASTWVNPGAGENEDKAGTVGGTNGAIYTASADAPYAITLKPGLSDTDKITKFFTSAASIDVVQPVYDYLGNVKTHGYVKIQGTPKETSKESKLAFTLTATNPSTKKKGAAKVTASAKTFPEIQKTTTIDDEKWITTKRVEAGKVPSVKVKAKGSKTISYKLGKYTVDDETGELSAETGYSTFNATMLANLKALKLSFDEKKGAVVLLDKSDKATKPTLNSDGDAFESLDIVITAVNNVGHDQAWAHVAITGAKPKMSDKSVTVEGTKQTGDTITFKVLAGKDAAETLTDGSANVKVYAADSTAASTLSKYGLALVPYDSMDVIVSAEVTFTAGATIPAYDEDKNPIVEDDTYASYYDENGDLVTTGDTPVILVEATSDTAAYYTAGSNGVTLLSGDTWAKSADTSLKNYGILQVIDPEALAKVSQDKTANKGVSVNLTLENLGSTNKGKLKVIIKDTVDGGDPLDPVVTTTTTDTTEDASSESTGAAPKTNGTASLTYNGALPEDADAEAEADAEGTVTFGTPRTVADLTAGQQAFLAEKGYTVVAVLPEITADVSDQYKLENIELDEDAPEGATLIWIAFPKNAPASEDDEIVDFYDEAGTPVEGVPASHKIIASPWLREAVTYEPVIAIEAK